MEYIVFRPKQLIWNKQELSQWKESVIVAIYKDDETCCSDYRVTDCYQPHYMTHKTMTNGQYIRTFYKHPRLPNNLS